MTPKAVPSNKGGIFQRNSDALKSDLYPTSAESVMGRCQYQEDSYRDCSCHQSQMAEREVGDSFGSAKKAFKKVKKMVSKTVKGIGRRLKGGLMKKVKKIMIKVITGALPNFLKKDTKKYLMHTVTLMLKGDSKGKITFKHIQDVLAHINGRSKGQNMHYLNDMKDATDSRLEKLIQLLLPDVMMNVITLPAFVKARLRQEDFFSPQQKTQVLCK